MFQENSYVILQFFYNTRKVWAIIKSANRSLYILICIFSSVFLPVLSKAQLVANFTSSVVAGCSPIVVQFTNQSTGSLINYSWDLGNGTTTNMQNPSTTYFSPGVYTVTLIVNNGSGSDTITNSITVYPTPIINFTADSSAICPPKTLQFNNHTIPESPGVATYLWDFGNGSTSTLANPPYVYTTTGTYSITLIATNSAGCSKSLTKPNYIRIKQSPIANFTLSNGATCTNKSISFINATMPNTSFCTWHFGNGDTSNLFSPSHAYMTPGTYPVTLISTYDGCSDTEVQNVNIIPTPAIQFTASSTIGCSVPFNTQFSNTTNNATSYLWLFGDGSTSTLANPSHTYTSVGNYTVKLIGINANGCTDTFTRANYINIQIPAINITNTSTGCVPSNIGFQANISSLLSVTNYTWDFGDGSNPVSCSSCISQSHTYTSPGTYTVTLTCNAGSGCVFSTQKTITLSNKPNASFTVNPDTACPGQPITCTNSSTGATSYIWYNGAGGTNTSTNPVFSYKNGAYAITLVTINNGCTDTFIKNVTIKLPRPLFTTSYSCTNRLNIQFTDQSLGANTYFWMFGDGDTSTTSGNVSHLYNAYGTYTVKLGVKNNASGCTDTSIIQLNIAPLPPVQFNVTDTTVCQGDLIVFSANAGTNINSYSWNLGGGDTSNSSSHKTGHAYKTPGTHTVKLVISDVMGCKDSMIKTNYIRVGGATVNFANTPDGGCLPLIANFQDQSTGNAGFNIVSRVWDFGTGGISTQTTPTHTYAVPGKYTVKLTVTDANNCTSTLSKADCITASRPIATFSRSIENSNICIGQAISFINTSSGNNIFCTWHFGDGSTGTDFSGLHAYSAPGIYTVKLIVTDMYGCKDSMIHTACITVSAPNLDFIMSDSTAACPPLAVNFTNASTGALNYTWNFGNNNQSTLSSPTATYTYPNTYVVKLVGQSAQGCKDSVQKTIKILGPTANISYTPITGCLPLTVNFSAVTNNTSSIICDMSNGVIQNVTSNTFSHTFTNAGKYLPRFILSDNASCLVPIWGTDTIKADHLNADFSFSPNNLCYSGTIQFYDTVFSSLTPADNISWTFGDGGISTAHNPSHTYIAPGAYQVTLVIGNTTGCSDTIKKTINVYQRPNVSVGNNQSICEDHLTPLTLQPTGGLTYTWLPTTGLSCTNCTNPTVLPTITTTYIVTGKDSNGCSDTGAITITVNPKPVINVGNNQPICFGSSIQLLASGAVTYSWLPTTALSCASCANPVANPADTATYKIIGISNAGCADSTFVTINVKPLPTITTGNDTAICIGSSASLHATGGINYIWSPSADLSCTNCANPTATPTVTNTYIVSGTGTNGCTDTSKITVILNSLPFVNTGADKTICAGFPTSLQATGALTYNWSPVIGLSCSNCPTPVANPAITTSYTVTGTDTNKCVNTDSVSVIVNPIPVIASNGNQTICLGNTTQLLVSGGTSYTWSPVTSLSCTNCYNPMANPGITTMYRVTGSSNGCKDSTDITITVLPQPTVFAGTDTFICAGKTIYLNARGAKTYIWSPATSLSCANCPNPISNPKVTTTYKVSGIDSVGCSNVNYVTVIVNPNPDINAGDDQIICEGSSAQLQVVGGLNYNWDPETDLSCINCENPVSNPFTTICYTVTGKNAYGCSDADTITISVINKTPLTVGAGDTLCKGDSTQLSAFGGTSYLWTPANGLNNNQIPDPVAIPDTTTEYTVTIKQGNCFTDTGHATVTVNDLPIIELGQDKHIYAGNSIALHSDNADIAVYKWFPPEGLDCSDCASPIATPKNTTLYTVNVTNKWECSARDNITVHVSCNQALVFIPNTFTPNADGINDIFYPQGKGVTIINRFSIYNRLGQLIYDVQDIDLNNPAYGWDGTYKNERLKPDVFIYVLKGKCDSNEPIEITGDITLIL